MIALLLMLATSIVDGPCGRVDKALAQDAFKADDSLLRDAAATADDAGDPLLATRLLIRLRDRTRDEAVRAEAQDALVSIKASAPRVSCETEDRTVVVAMHKAAFLTAAERDRLGTIVVAELRSRGIEATVEPLPGLAACDLDERCIRKVLSAHNAGAYLRLLPLRVGPVVTVDAVTVGFKGRAEHRFELDADSARWAPVMSDASLTDVVTLVPPARNLFTRRSGDAIQGTDPLIAVAVVAGVGVLAAGAGAFLLVDPSVLGQVARDDQNTARLIGIGAATIGGAVVVGSVVAVALIVDARNDG
jgi:hypothetical protein